LIFPVHPRTRARLIEFGLLPALDAQKSVRLIDPLGYVEFMSLVSAARLVLTDSGGVQEETSYLDIPCLTLRDTTERPITVSLGSNRLVALREVVPSTEAVLADQWPRARLIPYWDGKTASRIVSDIRRHLKVPSSA
jgi:UDP-N-acetylglucosamine 2-epimerase (non-hydrolysing)